MSRFLLYARKFAAAGSKQFFQNISFRIRDINILSGCTVFHHTAGIAGKGKGISADGYGDILRKSAGRIVIILHFSIEDFHHFIHIFSVQFFPDMDIPIGIGNHGTIRITQTNDIAVQIERYRKYQSKNKYNAFLFQGNVAPLDVNMTSSTSRSSSEMSIKPHLPTKMVPQSSVANI